MTLIDDFRAEAQAVLAASGAPAHLGAVLAAVEAAIAVVDGVVGVSVTLVHDGQPYTLTAVSEQMRLLDAAQYVDGGPCVEAAEAGEIVRVDDMFNDKRWRLFARAARGHGVGSSLSLPLSLGGAPVGAVNFYGGAAHVFSEATVRTLEELLSGRSLDGDEGPDLSFLSGDAPAAFDPIVEQAVGVLMEMYGGPPEQ